MGVLIEVVGVSVPVCGFHLDRCWYCWFRVSTLGMIGADKAAEAAKETSVVVSFGTIMTLWLMSNVAGVCMMAHWSTQSCEAPAMHRNDDPYGLHKNQTW